VDPDQLIARSVAAILSKSHHVLIDTDIPSGKIWAGLIDDELPQSELLVAIISPTASRSDMVLVGIELAHRDEVESGRPVIVPVRQGMAGRFLIR
jgi:hypothetical protein